MTLGLIASGLVMLASAVWGIFVWLRREPEKPSDQNWYESGLGQPPATVAGEAVATATNAPSGPACRIPGVSPAAPGVIPETAGNPA